VEILGGGEYIPSCTRIKLCRMHRAFTIISILSTLKLIGRSKILNLDTNIPNVHSTDLQPLESLKIKMKTIIILITVSHLEKKLSQKIQ